MRTVRRLYFYAVAFISLEVVLWGMIGLARSIICKGTAVCGVAAILTQGLAAIIVGIPFFGIHWWLAERFARQDADERASGVRAVFLYGVLLGTLIPIVQNFVSLLDRLVLQAASLSPYQAMFGPNQTWTDNLIAVVMNAIVAAYFITVLRADWQVITPKDTFINVRRLYRHVWLIYSLGLVIVSVQQLLRFILNISPNTFDLLYRASGAHGIVLALIGAPLWYFSWKTVRAALVEPAERESLLRLGVLYLLSLAGVISVLSAGGVVVDVILRAVFGEATTFAGFVQKIALPLSIGIPLAGIWAYYGGWLGRAIAESPDAPRRAGMRRLYSYILSAIGLGATFTGLSLLLSFVVDASVSKIVWADALRPRLAASLATLLVGLPLWWLNWRPMQADALSAGDSGDHARRSIIRKIFLYLALFVGVVGGMIVAVILLNILLRSVFGSTVDNLLQQVLNDLELLFLFVGLGLYHGLVLGKDGKMASQNLAEKHAGFPVLVFDPGEGIFGQVLQDALHKHTPRLPVTIQLASQPIPNGAAPKAIILPADLAMTPPESVRKWLGQYTGNRLLVPLVSPGLIWAGGTRPLPAAAAQAAQAVRQLAEGQEVRQQSGPSAWMIVVYIIAGFFGLELLFGLIALVMSLLGG
jgi:hypothetical protein